jgi:two-component system, NtrC family, C4-dicarboxylate transport response regulator DctD
MAKHSLLVVDDDPVILKLVCAFLTRSLADVHVETTNSSNAALQRATAHQYSAVLTDVMMPGMSGMELATKIHAARPDMPIIFMSGMAQALEYCRPRAYACLQKPFDVEIFVDTVRSAVAGSPYTRA